MSTASELVEGIRDLVALPEAYLKIQSLLRDPNSGIDDFSRVVQADPATAARVLRIANSAFFGVTRKVETITLAISLMGISRLHDIVLATSVIGSFDNEATRELNMAAFWRRSIHAGILSRLLAEACGIFDSERLFVGGLLHDIGHLVMHMRASGPTATALRRSREESRALPLVEREELGCDYGEVGAALMASWQFPDSLQEVCALHAAPEQARRFRRECALVALAQHAVYAGDPDPASLPFLPPPSETTYSAAGLDPGEVERLAAGSYEYLIEAVDLLMQKKAA